MRNSAETWRLGMTEENLDLAPSPTPLVSVAITAYNSANWLARALESVLQQRTNFSFEIVIGDDCSQDDTVSIANSYREKHPTIIKVLERTKNIGIQRNYYETFENCRGKFIAWLDADDYWTDPEKLAIQVETLEADPSINICCHFVRWIKPDGEIKRDKWPYISAGRYGLEEILRSCFIPTPSVMFRAGIHRKLPAWYFDLAPITDWPIWVLSTLSGDIVLLDRIMADYVHTPGSASTSKGSMFLYNIEVRFYDTIESILPANWRRFVRAEKGKRYESIAYWVRKQGDFTASRQAAFKAFSSPLLRDNVGSKTKALLAAVVREAEWRLRGGRTAE
jgi:glycosyltransferase involved in cell wall biosynthesis